jgi:phytoene/squalene synthetase
MNCETLLNDQFANLSVETTTLPTPMRVGLLSQQILIKAMKKTFKQEQSLSAVNRFFEIVLQQQSTSDELLSCAVKELHALRPDEEKITQMKYQLEGYLNRKGFDTTAEFNQFVDQVFGGFGYIVSLLFQTEANYSTLKSLLVDVAKAIGVSRTLRELHEDANRDFYMFSKEDMNQYQVDINALKGQKITENFAQLINSYIEVVRRQYENFYSNIALFPPAVRYPIYTFVKLQEAILDEIIWNRYDCLNTDLTVSPLRQTFIRFKAKRVIKRLGA